MRILIVDDNPDIRFLISLGIGYAGRCDLAENGLVAVELFRQASQEHDPYSLITMDCQMPVLDGFGAISMIRTSEVAQNENSFHSTICIISADDNCLQRYEQKNGLDNNLHYLRKPFLIKDLDALVQIALARTHSFNSLKQLPLKHTVSASSRLLANAVPQIKPC